MFFFFKQKTAYEIKECDWSSDVCSSDLGSSADAVYIGRGSPFGNPFVIGRDGDRDEVCDKFERYIEQKPQLIALVKRKLHGKNLVCFCAPQRCHGETLLRIANATIRAEQNRAFVYSKNHGDV